MEESRYLITYRVRGKRWMGQEVVTCAGEVSDGEAMAQFNEWNPHLEAEVAIPVTDFRE